MLLQMINHITYGIGSILTIIAVGFSINGNIIMFFSMFKKEPSHHNGLLCLCISYAIWLIADIFKLKFYECLFDLFLCALFVVIYIYTRRLNNKKLDDVNANS